MIKGWKNRGDCWTSISSPDIVQEPVFEGYLEIPGHGLSSLSGRKKNDMRLLRSDPLELLRQEGALDTGPILWGCSDLPGGGGPASLLPEVCSREAREAGLGFEQSFLHEAICDLCRAEVPNDDDSGCGEGAEARLAYGEGPGQRVYGETASTVSCCGSWGDRDRRDCIAQGASVSDCGK